MINSRIAESLATLYIYIYINIFIKSGIQLCYNKIMFTRIGGQSGERELYSNKIIKIEARIAFISDNKKQADYI